MLSDPGFVIPQGVAQGQVVYIPLMCVVDVPLQGMRWHHSVLSWMGSRCVNPLLTDGFFDDFVEKMRPGLQFVFRLHERGQTSSPFDQGMIKGRIRLSP